MLTARAYLALAGIGVVVALALTIIAWSRERDVSAGLRRDLVAAHTQYRELSARNDALAQQQAVTCGVEGSTAFDRGVQVGVAVCEARAPR